MMLLFTLLHPGDLSIWQLIASLFTIGLVFSLIICAPILLIIHLFTRRAESKEKSNE
jgi:uncharacterized membrane protein YciS (DUF1049 family)